MNTRRRLILLGAAFVLVAACADTEPGVSSSKSDQAATATVPDTDPGTVPPDTATVDTPETVPTTVPETDPDTVPPTVDTVPTTEDTIPPDPTNPVEPPEDTTPPPPPDEEVISFGDAKEPRDYDNFLNAAFFDIIRWWEEQYPILYGEEWIPLSGIYALYPDRTDLPEHPCGGEVPYEEVEMNAFYATCGDETGAIIENDIIVYDDERLFPELDEKLGAASLGIVAAHEMGHAVSARAGIYDRDLPTVDTEQQADCFAGAWAAHVARGESDWLPAFGDEEVKAGLAAMIEVRDPVGSDVLDPSGHGTAFDRVGAFQEGFLKGPERCRDFTEGQPNPRVDLVFTDQDFETGGNLPYDEILELLPPSLDTFWVPTLEASGVAFTPPTLEAFQTDGPYPECRGLTGPELKNRVVYCPESHKIVYDEAFLRDLHGRLGDLSFGYPLAAAYSDAVQTILGFTLTGEPEALLNDCLVGAWIVDIVPRPGTVEPTNPAQEIVLSAGDLDEAVLTAVLLGDPATNTNLIGTAFEKIDAFRSGVLGGLPACQARLG